MERTLVLLKPDTIARGLIGEITTSLERKGLFLVGCKMLALTDELLDEHYAHLADKPFFGRLASFMKQTPVLAQAWQGVDAVSVVREFVGVTNGREAAPGTVRGSLAMSVQCNLVHASDAAESARQELARFFEDGELFEYEHPLSGFVNSSDELE